MGKQPTYSADEIAAAKAAIIDGLYKGRSLARIITRQTKRKKGRFPQRKLIYTWLNSEHANFDLQFRNDYAGAREDSADLNAETIEGISRRVLRGDLDPQAARVAIDALKWTAARKKPKTYSERLDVTTGGDPIESQVVVIKLPDNGREESKPEK